MEQTIKERRFWFNVLKSMAPYHQKSELIQNCLEKLSTGEISQLTERQIMAIEKIYSTSWYKKQVDAKLTELIEKEKTAMHKEIETKLDVPDTDELTLPEPNKYNMNNVKKQPTRKELFDQLFNDDDDFDVTKS